MLRLAWPVLLEQILITLVGLADLWLTGNFLEQPHLAAIGFMSYVLWLIPSTFGAVAIGATALTARFVGAGQRDDASRVANQALLIGVAFAAVVTLAVGCGGGLFVGALRLPADAAPLAERYLWLLTPVIGAMMAEQVGIACLRGAGDTLSGFVAMALVNVVNIAVGACLVMGLGPFPKLGWDGLAIGTACGYLVGAAVILGLLVRGRAGLRLRWSLLRPDRELIGRLLRIGVPGGTDMLLVVCCHLWFVSIINSLGTLAAAAHGLGVRIESLAYLPGSAFHVAAATLTGQYLGAGDYRRAVQGVRMACLVGGGVMVSAGLLFFFCGEALTSVFLGSSNRATAELTVPLLKVVAVSMPSLALSIILTGALRGAGDTRWPLVFTLVGFLGVRIPAAYLLAWDEVPLSWLGLTLPGLGLGVMGAWYAMVADVVLRSLLVLWRFTHGGWSRLRV
ncbi:MAG: MATE family efflux transporter [Pirellulaceae bacterium]|nr:MATE family efflux transporter [Pirellulaceae bacterium]